MSTIEFLYSPASADNPFEIAKRKLLAQIARLPVPIVDPFPAPEQMHDVADHVRAIAQAADEWLCLIGLEVKSNAMTRVDLKQFNDDVFLNAVEGYAIWEIERVAEDIREEEVA